jgi:uncharacterized membrane protein
MAYPTDGFTSKPVSIHVTVGDNIDSSLSVISTLDIAVEGSGAIRLTEDQTQALFNAVGDAVKTYLTTEFATAIVQSEVVNYSGSKDVALI